MAPSIRWNRRRFLQLAGGAAVCGAWGERAGVAESLPTNRDGSRFTFVGSEQGIHVYSLKEPGLVKKQTVASQLPVAMAISNAHLYVANGVSQHGSLPCGSVETYAIETGTGLLKRKGIVPLSLSATAPRDLVVSPDGRSLVVAVYGGGAFNLLPIEEGGHARNVSSILKEIGSGPHPSQAAAHPSAVVFDRSGRVLAADQGNDRLSLLGLDSGAFMVAGRWELAAGSGPSSLVMHPMGSQVYVGHALNGSVSTFDYDAEGLHHSQTVQVRDAADVADLAIHPSGKLLYSTHGKSIHAWCIEAGGKLQRQNVLHGVRAKTLHITPDGNHLLVLTGDAVLSLKTDAWRGWLGDPVRMAPLSNPMSIATL